MQNCYSILGTLGSQPRPNRLARPSTAPSKGRIGETLMFASCFLSVDRCFKTEGNQ